MSLRDKHVLVTGGTGSLGHTIVRRMLGLGHDAPRKITVFSRDEAKQHYMKVEYRTPKPGQCEVAFRRGKEILNFIIGDMRDYDSVCRALKGVDIVVNAAALKQVPSCELFPFQAVQTNVIGAQNLVRAIRDTAPQVKHVVGISTDKACKPINVMGMSKALMERLFIEANLQCPGTRFNLVRYGNVIASRGSVVPLFEEQIKNGGPVTITTKDMTRFLLTLDQAVDTVFAALDHGNPGETYVPQVDAARIVDLARVMIDGRDIPIVITGIRPGEKIHEIMVSDEERYRTVERKGYYVIQPMLDELMPEVVDNPVLTEEYSSSATTLSDEAIIEMINPILEDGRFSMAEAA
jgi:FlaA1/EpsC-like NDP-sugar epimerase